MAIVQFRHENRWPSSINRNIQAVFFGFCGYFPYIRYLRRMGTVPLSVRDCTDIHSLIIQLDNVLRNRYWVCITYAGLIHIIILHML
uniref:Uncharacterized protein n=1 Tax=Arundo donax TaxID=35708 RepID=A0A0A9E7K5_ARUDO